VTLPLARRERLALCDAALELGPDVPTLCDGWDCRDLLAHLVVREHTVLGAVGIPFAPLASFTERGMRRWARAPFPRLVERVREVGWTPYRLPPVEKVANTLEYFVHHEDLRRGQADWAPRSLPTADEDELWRQLRGAGRLNARRGGVPVSVRRSDTTGATGPTMSLLGGDDPVTVTGRPSELVLMLFGRRQLRDLTYDGPPAAVAKLKGADLGF
jgi:uncharacterized protein (TIGR03085 family)